jgi:hypothetical protein
MYFACTGLLISWHVRTRARVRTTMGMRTRMRARSVILTSASLVRSCDEEEEIDNSLRVGAPNHISLSFKFYVN